MYQYWKQIKEELAPKFGLIYNPDDGKIYYDYCPLECAPYSYSSEGFLIVREYGDRNSYEYPLTDSPYHFWIVEDDKFQPSVGQFSYYYFLNIKVLLVVWEDYLFGFAKAKAICKNELDDFDFYRQLAKNAENL